MNRKLPLLALLTAFPPLATDMYLPAIPTLQKQWNQPLSIINLTLVCFFITYCIALLFYGPISDRYGRRPPLMAGIGLYVLACILCALSPNAESLIVFRIIQAAGAAAAATLAMAISKDLFTGKEREQILAVIAVIVSLAPMLAPVLGGWLLKWLSWPWIFVSQAILGAISFAGVYKMEALGSYHSMIRKIYKNEVFSRLVIEQYIVCRNSLSPVPCQKKLIDPC